MTAAEFSDRLLADFHHRLHLESLSRLQPSPHAFGVGTGGPFGGGPLSIPATQDRPRGDYQPPSHLMLQVMAQQGGDTSAEHPPNPVYQGLQHVAQPARGHDSSFKPASAAITSHERAAYKADSTAAQQKRRLLDSSGGVECSYMGVGSGAGVWDAGSDETARRIATLQARLQQRLGPEYISTRAGPSGGPKVSYIEGWKAIDLANEVFGFNGWSSSIVSLDVDFLEEHPQTGRVNVAVSATVRITLRDGTYHEDVGYGSMDNSKSRAAALEKSKKEAVTDAMKRTLRTFGSVLGNCLYDKQFLRDISKVTLPPVKFDPSTLHRRPEFANAVGPRKPQSDQAGSSNIAADDSAPTKMVHAAATTSGVVPNTRTTTMPGVASTSHSRTVAQAHQTKAGLASNTYRSHTMGPSTTANAAPSRQNDDASRRAAVIPTGADNNVPEGNSSSDGNGPATDSDKARLVEQRRLEAQKRLARTKSMIQQRHAEANSTSDQASSSSNGPAAAPPQGNPSARKIELPNFGPQISRSASTTVSAVAATAGEGTCDANSKISTPFGPRFMPANNTSTETATKPGISSSKSKYPDDSAIFFAASDDESRDLESSRSDIRLAKIEPEATKVGGVAGSSKRMLLDNNESSRTDSPKSAGDDAEDDFDLDANDISDSQLVAMADKTPFRGHSVGRFTGLTPNSAALLRSGTTSLSAVAAAPVTMAAASTTSQQSASPSSSTRKHSLCGPLQPRRSNNATTGQGQSAGGPSSTAYVTAKPMTTPSRPHQHQRQQQRPRLNVHHGGDQESNNPTGLENLGLAERVSGVGIGIGKVSGRPTVAGPGRSASMLGGGVGIANKAGFAPASLAMSTTRPGAHTGYAYLEGNGGVKRGAENGATGAGLGDDGSAKRARR
ncbi:DNA repair protein rad52 [Tilletia horrida]|uniref:DNA repair protein rad52 n=1 Tax=Tilletia horrida TaxID=155126 RepID=A0AAN6JQH6_9BASI|nr:DNA repair protein rad52 [Tilletia horrida]KAK0542982.1 DNA repair protein rad52 [Tilletia horrida]KAK0559231.1 DNA repair protein rad52 [Tilletia horrida]